jgi:hypothetical protein
VSAGSVVTLSGTTVTGNAAVGGAGGSGATDYPAGPSGQGYGGGLCITTSDASPTQMTVDAYTLAHILGNAATDGPDILDPNDTIR